MKKKYVLVGILMKIAYDKFMNQTDFGKKWRYFWKLESTKRVFEWLFDRKTSFERFKEAWEKAANDGTKG